MCSLQERQLVTISLGKIPALGVGWTSMVILAAVSGFTVMLVLMSTGHAARCVFMAAARCTVQAGRLVWSEATATHQSAFWAHLVHVLQYAWDPLGR